LKFSISLYFLIILATFQLFFPICIKYPAQPDHPKYESVPQGLGRASGEYHYHLAELLLEQTPVPPDQGEWYASEQYRLLYHFKSTDFAARSRSMCIIIDWAAKFQPLMTVKLSTN
jgi:hypothetical protein